MFLCQEGFTGGSVPNNVFLRMLQTTDSDGGICCCNSYQIESIVVLCVTFVITVLLWKNIVFAPIKLIAVFLHELSHALATWLTCGKVKGIEVNENFGGVTLSQGGSRWITLSAGYIGSVLWGAFFVMMSAGHIPNRIATCFFVGACLATTIILRIKDKQLCGTRCAYGLVLRIVILIIAVIPIGLWILEDNVSMSVHPLRWCMLAIGTISTLFALFDCIHDVLLSKIDDAKRGKSDAVMFAEEFCLTPRFWGFLWSMIAVVAAALAIFFTIIINSVCGTTAPE